LNADLTAFADELCAVFLGWRLGQDLDALLTLEEGALRIDLASGEAWCDGEPIPPLFIAGELRRRLEEVDAPPPEAAWLDAAFEARRSGLAIACRVTLRAGGAEFSAERRREAVSR
jgi:hypothetical protein